MDVSQPCHLSLSEWHVLPGTFLPRKSSPSAFPPPSCSEVDGEEQEECSNQRWSHVTSRGNRKQRYAAKRMEVTAGGLEQIDIRNSSAALVPDLPALSLLGLPVSVTEVLTPNYASSSSFGSFPPLWAYSMLLLVDLWQVQQIV